MFSVFKSTSTSKPPFTILVPPLIYPAGSAVEGEVELDFRRLLEENIEKVQLRLHGTAETAISKNKDAAHDIVRLVDADIPLWTRGSVYPTPDSDLLRVPFRFILPSHLPPSFHYAATTETAKIRYGLTAVGVRKGVLNANRKHVVPLAVVPQDAVGLRVKEGSGRGVVHGWRTKRKEERIRKGLWGDYAKVEVEISLPDIPVLPLFSAIPYTVRVITTTAPLSPPKDPTSATSPTSPMSPTTPTTPLSAISFTSTSSKGKETAIFPPVPTSADDVELKLRRTIRVGTRMFGVSGMSPYHSVTAFTSVITTDILAILGKDANQASSERSASRPTVEREIAETEWVWIDGDSESAGVSDSKKVRREKGASTSTADRKGVWVQRAAFHSTFTLTCPPTFTTQTLHCEYMLTLKVPFPGMGNVVRLEVPIIITSGIDKPIRREHLGEGQVESQTLDLPPSYWDINDMDWRDDGRE
ncbi:hypothetical protein C8Q74DRAFT_1445288 [Fomes fomentarius]|nr:hypothetical protein C8Q74DRAFT_1445288 [Fomes fomentarius]